MGRNADPLAPLVDAVLARIAANESTPPPQFRSLDAEAALRGKSTRAFRAWCRSHGVPIRQDSHRDAWVSPADVDRAIAGFRVATAGDADDELAAVDRAIAGRHPRTRG